MFKYANVWLGEQEGTEVGAWVENTIKPEQLFPIASRSWAGYLTNGPMLNITPEINRPVRTGSLLWPWGASRFARAHFVVTGDMLNSIRSIVFLNGTQIAAPFVFADGNSSITANLWMLPAIPLLTSVTKASLYLLTLVDDRYWWWGTPVDLTIDDGVTTWSDLYSDLSTALGTTISVDSIASAYGTPTTEYTTSSLPAPPILDAIAFSVGQRIVRGLDGVVSAQNFATSKAILTSNQTAMFVPFAGGQLSLNPRA